MSLETGEKRRTSEIRRVTSEFEEAYGKVVQHWKNLGDDIATLHEPASESHFLKSKSKNS